MYHSNKLIVLKRFSLSKTNYYSSGHDTLYSKHKQIIENTIYDQFQLKRQLFTTPLFFKRIFYFFISFKTTTISTPFFPTVYPSHSFYRFQTYFTNESHTHTRFYAYYKRETNAFK